MIALTLAEVASAVGGTVVGASTETVVRGSAFVDSRDVAAGGLFVAVAGEHVDGHDYAGQAIAGGAAAALVQREVGVPAVVVADPVHALGLLAHHVLSRLPSLRVVGITGSQGKTSTKDIVAQLLASSGETIAAAGSYNNEIGVPLTALRATEATRFLVVEMGARGRGHVRDLAGMVRPVVGAVLNVGVAHIGEFGSQQGIARSKGELVEALPSSGVAVLNADDEHVRAMATRTAATVVLFGSSLDAGVRVDDIELDESGRLRCALEVDGVRQALSVPLVGEHHARNVAAAVAVALNCGVAFEAVPAVLAGLKQTSRWRMEMSTTASGLTIINDAYNANPDSMRAALQTLAAIGHRRRPDCRTFAVLGEMRELGEQSRDEHDAIGRLVVRLDIDQLVVVGQEARALHLGACLEGSWDSESMFVPDVESAVSFVRATARAGDVVLVKASRAAGLERVALALLVDDEGEPSR
ncbi:MAG: UDP-N-acetylmuramoyl-tripeptide--D-alanyl-D-alanine ligase [Actinomycetota bacterium]|nr:UDP-N-acetylmuramoyl-tripeptide--D-alanyl-D-alanine ligase [Nocardioidaceae bacterium]MDQ3480571.1 UDP-N-acetylmuramoyl-tripeptide--D-alanyl-D-alanine ligase [Actinomycetota bacterium]